MMSRNLARILLSPLLAGCPSGAGLLTSQGQSWGAMQSVGGLRIDAPVVEADGSTYLPLLCDVSGLQTITVKPTAMNSSQVVRQIVVQRRKEKIQLQVVTGIADNQRASVARGVSLGRVPEGVYQLEYVNPDGSTVMLKEIKILKPNKASHATP
jgi:hypothetical protein